MRFAGGKKKALHMRCSHSIVRATCRLQSTFTVTGIPLVWCLFGLLATSDVCSTASRALAEVHKSASAASAFLDDIRNLGSSFPSESPIVPSERKPQAQATQPTAMTEASARQRR